MIIMLGMILKCGATNACAGFQRNEHAMMGTMKNKHNKIIMVVDSGATQVVVENTHDIQQNWGRTANIRGLSGKIRADAVGIFEAYIPIENVYFENDNGTKTETGLLSRENMNGMIKNDVSLASHFRTDNAMAVSKTPHNLMSVKKLCQAGKYVTFYPGGKRCTVKTPVSGGFLCVDADMSGNTGLYEMEMKTGGNVLENDADDECDDMQHACLCQDRYIDKQCSYIDETLMTSLDVGFEYDPFHPDYMIDECVFLSQTNSAGMIDYISSI